ADDNVHYQNTAEYVEALVQADKDFRQLVYTNRNHSIYGGIRSGSSTAFSHQRL
ncbi:MAG: prolyl oligopeptidase family serine peptidase, partial [Ruminococcus sp.]|nr:prolyl oligopeptidase family serine peptidase [Ruminococcus sp.]